MSATKTELTKEDAIEFVRNKLGIEDIEVAEKSLDMLSRIQRNLLSELPFQNVSLIATPLDKRFPTIEDAISDGLSLRGGTCIHNNWFFYLLLKALGYDIFPVGANYCGEREMEDMHMLLMVKGLKDPRMPGCKEPLFLADAASGYPLPAPVPVHGLPITYPETAGLEVRFDKIGDSIFRLQHDNDPHPSETHPLLDGWKVVVKIDLKPRDPPSFRKGMEASFCAEPPSTFTSAPRMFRWPKSEEWAVGMRENVLMFYGKTCPEPECPFDENIRKHKMTVRSHDLERIIQKYFPMICRKQLDIFIREIERLKRKRLTEEAYGCAKENIHSFTVHTKRLAMTTKVELTRHEAVEFVRDKLGIKDMAEDTPTTLEILGKIQRHIMSQVPFQNISLISTPPERRFPSVEDAIDDGLSLRGGTCIHNNWFSYILLKALGYDVYPIAAIYCAEEELEDRHLMLVIKGLSNLPGEEDHHSGCEEPLYLFDAASGHPLPDPVPLHRLPIKYPETAGLELSFAKYGEYIYRMHHDNDPLPTDSHPMLDGWKVIMKFTVEPRDPASLRKGMEKSFCADQPGPFLRSTRMFRWPAGEKWAVAIRGYELMFFGKECPESECRYDEKKRKHKMILKDADLKKNIVKYFPMICPNQLNMFISKIEEYKNLENEEEKNSARK